MMPRNFNEKKTNYSAQQGFGTMQAISVLGTFTVSIQLSHRGTMMMFQSPALYQPPAVANHLMKRHY